MGDSRACRSQGCCWWSLAGFGCACGKGRGGAGERSRSSSGLATTALTRPPDIVIADSGRFVAARAADGRYFVSADKGEKMPRSFLAAETGETLRSWPEAEDKSESGLDCSGELCLYSAHGRRCAIVTGASALPGQM